MRKLPDIPPPEEITPQPLEVIEQIREYQLITPLFGGGVTPGEVDPLTPIRGAEIRGHLRFWWRATRGGEFGGDLAKMKEKEDAIWGKASFKEKKNEADQAAEEQKEKPIRTVQIEVIVNRRGESKKPFDIQGNTSGRNVPRPADVPGYATFLLLPTNDDLRQKTKEQIEAEMKRIQHNVQFTLKITYPETYRKDIQAALWAWETFGGIGARTRRGFGALRLLKVEGEDHTNCPASNQPADVRSWLNENAKKFVTSGAWPGDVPHLEKALSFAIAYPRSRAFESWNELIKRYVSFRQFRTKGYAGRSNWPEAETIREKTGRRYQDYKTLGHPDKFPRAAFGLPIVFHFKDEKKGDPHDTTLQGANEGNERLASPLILRPLVCGDERAIGLAVVLKGSQIPPLVLKGTNKPVEAQLDKSDLTKLPNLNADKLNGETDVLQAFLNDLKRTEKE
jgi:CRISPR-associated protein Cmr1